MSFVKVIAKAAISGLVESFASAAGTADRLLQKEATLEPEKDPDVESQSQGTSDPA